MSKLVGSVFFTLVVCQVLFALDSSQVTFHAPFDGGLQAKVAKGSPSPLTGIKAEMLEGVRGQAVKVGKSTWGGTQELRVIRMPVDVGLWRDYGNKESLGPLRYPAKGNINDKEGTLSLWYKPVGWELANSRDHFIVNLGMTDTLALAYLTYFGCFSFQNSIGENTYKRCIGYLPPELYAPKITKDTWTNLTMSWRDDLMKTWINGKPLAVEREEVIPLRNSSGELRFGSGDYQEAAFDDVIILAQAVGDADAKALYNRNQASGALNFLSVPTISPPTIDGKVGAEGEWKGASAFTGWADSILGVANKDNTSVRIGHDDKALYVAFLWPIPEKFKAERTKYVGSPLKVTVKDRDADLSQDDFVGVYLQPPGSQEVYSFGLNGGGAMRDEKNGDAFWNGVWQANQSYDDNYWVAELAIPLKNLGANPMEGADWGINFVHVGKQVDLFDSLWAYQPAQLRPLARMKLSTGNVSVQVSSLGDLNEGQLSIKGSLVNNGTEVFTGESEVNVQEEDKVLFGPEKKTYSLAPGEKKDLEASFALRKPLCGEAILRFADDKGNPLLSYRLPFVFSRELRLEGHYVPTPAVLQTVLDFGSTSTLQKASSGQLTISSLDTKKTLITRPLAGFEKVREILDIDCKSLPVGKYEVVVELSIGSSVEKLKDTFEKNPAPEWLGNKVGFSDKAPAPWTPLKVSGNKVSCWGRTQTLGAAGLPTQVVVLGKDLLASPVRVIVSLAGRSQTLPPTTPRVTQAKETRVSCKSSTTLRGLRVDSDTWIEFDGFSWNTLKVSAAKPVTVDSLSIEVPLKPEYATLWWPAEYVPSGPGGETPKSPYDSDPINGMRIGDEEHGLQFSFESTKNWVVDAGKGQQLIPGEKEYVVRFNLIAKPTKIEKPMEFSFGLQALPARPRSPYFRSIDADANWSGSQAGKREYLDKTGKLFFVSPVYTEGWDRHWNYLNFWNEDVFEKEFLDNLVKGRQQQWDLNKNTLCMYLNVSTNDANTPEFREYRHEWRAVPGDAPYVPADPETRNKVVLTGICVNPKSYTDFYMYYLDRTVKALSDKGKIPLHVYLDNSAMIYCSNYLHGCPKEGRLGVLAHREYMKRLYNIVKSTNPLNQIYIHCSGDNRMSSWGFSDMMIEGEQMSSFYMSRLANDPTLPKNYTKLITLAKARSQFSPLAYGPDRMYLYQFWGWNKTEPDEAAPARAHLLGLMMVHDSPCWAAGYAENIVKATEELGWDDKVDFVPYWRKGSGIEVTSSVQPMVASSWKRGDGNLMVMVFNDSDKADQCQLRIDFAKYGFRSGKIKCSDYGHGGLPYPDSLKPQDVKESVVEASQSINVDIGERSYRLLRFSQ
ncbi:MAG: hypothetical protein HY318_07535 [Armatimonadetes bacterium]|nr:hypothetical protein [Armatimonadota bacterium]